MATHKRKQRRPDEDVFYEALPLQRPGYQSWPTNESPPDAPDHDFAAIEDDGRTVAIKTLILVALATVALCLFLLWAVQAAQATLPSASSLGPQP